MRHKVLARALNISVADLLIHLGLSERRPLQRLPLSPLERVEDDVPFSETVHFMREVERTLEASLTAGALEGLCRNRGDSVDFDMAGELTNHALLALGTLPPVPTKPETTTSRRTSRTRTRDGVTAN